MNVAVKPSKHTAPGQYLGYALQPVRLCYYLLSGPADCDVSLEHAEDVAVHFATGQTKYEQTKSALGQNPLTNYSDELWKTIAIWIEGIAAGTIALQSSAFSLYVTPVHKGEWATLLDKAASKEEVEALVALIEADLKKQKKPPACLKHLLAFLHMHPAARVDLVSRLSITSVDDDPVEPIRQLLHLTIAPELMDLVCAQGMGHAKAQADRLLRARQPAKLNAGAFQEEFRAFVRKNNLPNLLVSVAKSPDKSQVADVLSSRPVFIRQLEFIDATQDQQVRAVSDYLRTAADRASWAETGLVFENDFETWDDDLMRRFALTRDEVAETHRGESAEIRGRLIYIRCAKEDVRLMGREVPGHFVHGSFTSLADLRRLGWHPDFELLLGEQDQ